MKSLATISPTNDERFLQVLMQGDPELARVYAFAKETNFNMALLPILIRTITNLSIGTKFGKIVIYVTNGVVTNINPEESNKVDLPVIVPQPGEEFLYKVEKKVTRINIPVVDETPNGV